VISSDYNGFGRKDWSVQNRASSGCLRSCPPAAKAASPFTSLRHPPDTLTVAFSETRKRREQEGRPGALRREVKEEPATPAGDMDDAECPVDLIRRT